jgi:hypothetical protein
MPNLPYNYRELALRAIFWFQQLLDPRQRHHAAIDRDNQLSIVSDSALADVVTPQVP